MQPAVDHNLLSASPTPNLPAEPAGLGVYLRTLRFMRWSQLWWRVRYSLERRNSLDSRTIARWRWDRPGPPHLRTDYPIVPPVHPSDVDPTHSIDELERGVFRFLNRSFPLGREQPDWRLGSVATDRLWTITLHYHAWAYELADASSRGDAHAAVLFRHYITDWINRCSLTAPGGRDLAWNAFAIATRITWWIRSYQLLRDSLFREDGAFAHTFLVSLWEQAAYLRDHLEWDLRANHLLRDAVGLAWAGRFFQEHQAAEWLRTATILALDQAAEQILSDGGHFERSPMYHLHVMEDFFTLALLVEDEAVRLHLRDTGAAMAEYVAWLRHPDGDLALFNDGGLQGADHVEHLLNLGGQLGVNRSAQLRRGGRHFAASGMMVWQGDPWTVFFDVGPVGPDYQPGHAHADTLALECSFHEQRLFVDAGTYAYDRDAKRRYDRSTAAHNTVCIDGENSSEVWHIFRVGRRANPCDVCVDFSTGGMKASAAHTGYDHLPGRPRPTRQLTVADQGKLIITDRIDGQASHAIRGGFLLAPKWTTSRDNGGWLLRSDRHAVRVSVQGPPELVLGQEQRPYHPCYGLELPSTRLTWRWEGSLPLEVTLTVEGA